MHRVPKSRQLADMMFEHRVVSEWMGSRSPRPAWPSSRSQSEAWADNEDGDGDVEVVMSSKNLLNGAPED
jgi:hypothetical protein